MAVIYCRKAVCYGQTRITEILQFVALQSTPKPQPKVKYYAPNKYQEKLNMALMLFICFHARQIIKSCFPLYNSDNFDGFLLIHQEKKQAAPEEEEQKQPDLKATSQAAPISQARLQSKKPQLVTKEPISPKPTSSSPRKQLQQPQTETKEAKASVSQTKLTPLPPPSSPSTATKPNADPAQPLPTETEKASQTVEALPPPASAIQRASSAKETIMEETLRVTRGSLRKARSTGVPR